MEHDRNAVPRRFDAPPPPRLVPVDPTARRAEKRRPLLLRPGAWLTVYLIGLGLIAFWPQHVDSNISPSFLGRVIKLIPLMTYERLEFGANIVLFIPLGVLLALLLVRQRSLVLPIAFLASFTIECVQGLLLPGRTPSVNDILANTAGACIGLVLIALVERRRSRHDSGPGAD
ncbi:MULTISPECIES: VanZ family protein [Bacteria]|uniref:VanZ family protein n=1 Tax=Bacteria TaxID=2 RepID=UPI003C7C29E6